MRFLILFLKLMIYAMSMFSINSVAILLSFNHLLFLENYKN